MEKKPKPVKAVKKRNPFKRTIKRKTGVKVKNAVKSTYDGLQFDSNLELNTYKALKAAGIINFGRENWTVDLISPFRFNGDSYHVTPKGGLKPSSPKIAAMTYTPDFTCVDSKTKKGWVIECKGFRTELSPLKRKLFKQYLTTRGYQVDYYEPSNSINLHEVVKLIKEKYYGL